MNYMLSNIVNWHQCHAQIPRGYAVSAVIDAINEMWGDFYCIEQTAANGVCDTDLEIIEGLINDYQLDCDLDECEQALLAYCKKQVAAAKQEDEDEQ